MAYFKTHRIDDSTYYIMEMLGVGAYLFLGEDRALMSDTGNGYMDIRKSVAKITDKPLVVMNTHGHVDHAGGNEQFEEIHIHAADLEMLDPAWQQSQRDMLFGYVKKAYPIFVPVLMFFKLQRFAKCKSTVKTIEDGARFELGGRTLTVIHFPGHSPGSVILADDRTRTLYAGDAVNHGLFLFFENSPTLKEYGAALRKLARLEGFDSIRISHGAMTIPFDFIDYYAEFLDRVTLDKSVLTDIPNGDRPVLKYSESDERYGLPEIAVHFTRESLEG